MLLRDLANSQSAVVPVAGKAHGLRIFDHYPIHTKFSLQALKVCELETLPIFLRDNLAIPCGGELWNLTNDSRVFVCIRQLASFRQCTEAVIVLAWLTHVPCAEGKVSIGWSVLADPIERLQP